MDERLRRGVRTVERVAAQNALQKVAYYSFTTVFRKYLIIKH
jgi:hypothetical protein